MFRSATLKLTLYYLGIVMIISFCFSAVLYHDASNELIRQLNQQYQRWGFAIRYFDFNPNTPNPTPPNPVDEVHNGQRHLLLELTYFNALVLLAAGGASYILARKTLSPIEDAHEQQKRFTADVSHELRTPLTALKMESEVALLDKSVSKDSLRKTLGSNLEEVTKLEMLINNLLRLSQLENDKISENFTTVQLDASVQEAINQLSLSAKKRKIELKTDLAAVKTKGDPTLLTQLATIIIDNAIKYSLAGTTVTAKTSIVNNLAQLTVSDQGIGIEPDALPHIFDRFYRADKARGKQDSEGFGLGLSLAKMIADLHGGSISITSQLKKGTTVSVQLPSAS